MKSKGLLCAGLLAAGMVFCGTAYAEEQQAVQQENQEKYVYETADGVLSIEAPDAKWQVVSDPNYWFVLSDGTNSITIDHLANGEALPVSVVASGDTAAVFQAFVSTKNEVFVVKGSAAKQEDLPAIMKMAGTIKVLKFDTKTAVKQNTSATEAAPAEQTAQGVTINPINETYYCTSDSLNVRQGCSTSDAAIGYLYYGEAVTVLGAVTENGQETGWYQVSYNGTKAYESAQYLSKTKPQGTEANSSNSSSDEYFLVYGTDGISVAIHSVGGATYEDLEGRTYIKQGDGLYYCISQDSYFAYDRNTWSYDDNVNIEGDPYGDLVTGSDGVNIEGDPYGDLVTGSDGVNIEGDPYGDLVTGSDGVNVEG